MKSQILNPFLSSGGGSEMGGRSQARYRPRASYSLLEVLWLPQWPHLAAFIPHSEEGCNKRVLAATFGSSEVPALGTIPPILTQAADCYRALLVSPWD